ncbi:Homeobox domain-containing protein [Fusarium keratoplasticum]|uniref:Homeobox domain-containing protein n=1 Tax=Fusarium keratoplasticum TaxID=1328300 RepID=A0ACC0QQ69_9HYPO|nr:Homeobox domain-containing protein [Fusarium keratoplasticum]KAI8660594.1 Homeobox domain-containing protein [Fusarium keratoplasticum]KAI8661625.1 Homeobox domain-containing protein [Fusarium keratoplasticum]
MEDSRSLSKQSETTPQETAPATAKMSMLATASPSSHPSFGMPRPWEANRCPDYSLRPRTENDRVALPSIRQAFPELQLQPQPPQDLNAKPPSAGGPLGAPPMNSASPQYVHSPNASKRRRLSMEREQENERARQVPRLLYSPDRASPRQISPNLPMQPGAQDNWGPARTSPYLANGSTPHRATMEVNERVEPRPALPSLPPPRAMEREAAPVNRVPPPVEGYRSSHPPMPPHSGAPVPEAVPSAYREPNYGYPYHHPTRYQSLSAGSAHSFDRTPFTASGYNTPYQDFVRFGEMGPSSLNGDNKQRKRRGNLPKETTDKLRAWFVAHLQHPYPTEDEKQELMRQTGLQMNQISNWFINARRRQLPTMINNARAESDAMTGARGGGDMKILATTERGDFEHGKREPVGPLSDGEGATYDEDLETLSQRRTGNAMGRGSV